MESGERADAEGNGTEGVVAEVQVANGRSDSVERHRSELVVREVEHSEAGGPLRDIWNFCELVVGEVQLTEAWQLKDAPRNDLEVVVLQVKLHNLRLKEGGGGEGE